MKNKHKEYTRQFFYKNKINFVIAFLSTMMTSAINLLIAWLLQQMIDAISRVQGAFSIYKLTVLTLGVILLIIISKIMNWISKPCFIQRAMQQYKDYVFQKLSQKSIAAFSRENTANYISAFLGDAATIEKGYLEMLFDMTAHMVIFVGSLIMMLIYSPAMTVIACFFFVLPIGVSFITGNKVEKAEKKVSEKNGEFIATLKDSLSGFNVMKSFKAETAIASLVKKSNQEAEYAKCEKRKLMVVISGLAGVAGVTAQLGTFLIGACLVLSGKGITPGILVVFLDLTANVIGPIQEFPELFASKKAAVALIHKLAEALEDNVRDEGMEISKQLKYGIRVENVSFGYEKGCNILQNMNVVFEKGKSYAIVGASGSGKSTLLNLLMASYGNYQGKIYYDDYEMKEISSVSLYDMISNIQQNVFIFNASVRDNITMFNKFAEEEVERAIELSGLSKLMEQRGEDYICGENGSGLSGGEKQRISIARSLLRDAQVLLVDEATASLDAMTACQVSNAILDLEHITRIVVTHSLDAVLLKRYDCIMALKNGKIEEKGTFEELMKQKNYFYSLYTVSQ